MTSRQRFAAAAIACIAGAWLAAAPMWLQAQVPANAAAPAAQALNKRMQRVLMRFVEETGHPVMGVGSWISGAKFNSATSDFDMRLVIPEGVGPDQQLLQWRNARTRMTKLIEDEFGAESRGILSRTNLYAPNQLMAGVEDAEDAMSRYLRMNTVPSLSHSGAVTEKTVAKYGEGLYGAGAPTYVQGYERQAGRLFYVNNGRATTGLSELAHLGEGTEAFTAAGTANTAGQWAEHCVAELQAGRGDKVAKYLERLERDLVKSRSLSGVPINDAFRSQLADLKALLKKSPGRLTEVAGDVSRVLARSRAEAAILGSMENAGPLRRAYLKVMLDGVAAGNKLGTLVDRIMKQAPSWADANNAMGLLVVGIGLRAVSESAGRGDDVFETAANVLGATNLLTMYPPGLLAEVMAEVINEARANGYDMMAGSQEAWDLMSGIYSSWGRAGTDPDPRRKLTLADLVARFQYEHHVEALVLSQAIRASTRGLGSANEQADDGVAQAIFAKCWPVIRSAWKWERDALAAEYLKLASVAVHTPLAIYYKPAQPRTGERIAAEAVSADGKLGDRLERMKEILRILYGPGSGIAVNYYWDPAGQAGDGRDYQRAFTFTTPGTQTVKVRLEIAPFTKHTETEPRVMLRREVPALVDIEVGGGATSSPVTARPAPYEFTTAGLRFRSPIAAWAGPPGLGVDVGNSGFDAACRGTLTGNTFTCSGVRVQEERRATVKGTFVFNATWDRIISFSYETENFDSITSGHLTSKATGGDVPLTGRHDESEWQMFSVEGAAACKHVKTASMTNTWPDGHTSLASFACNTESKLEIGVGWSIR